jgi:hypothetical protein
MAEIMPFSVPFFYNNRNKEQKFNFIKTPMNESPNVINS